MIPIKAGIEPAGLWRAYRLLCFEQSFTRGATRDHSGRVTTLPLPLTRTSRVQFSWQDLLQSMLLQQLELLQALHQGTLQQTMRTQYF